MERITVGSDAAVAIDETPEGGIVAVHIRRSGSGFKPMRIVR
jgi:hypothetical protein